MKLKKIICSKDYDALTVLQGHLSNLKEKKEQIEMLIRNVEKNIAASKGEMTMSDSEKFEGFKTKYVLKCIFKIYLNK